MKQNNQRHHRHLRQLCVFGGLSLMILSHSFSSEINAQASEQKLKASYEAIRVNIRQGDLDKALFLLDKIQASTNKDAESHFLRGRILQEMKKNTEALTSYTLAIYLKPDMVKAYINRALVKGALVDTQGAIEDLNRALNLQPANAAALLNRGVTYASLNKPALALKDFNQAIQIDGRYADAFRNRGIIKYLMNDQQGACAEWAKSNELGPSDTLEWSRNLCRALQKVP